MWISVKVSLHSHSNSSIRISNENEIKREDENCRSRRHGRHPRFYPVVTPRASQAWQWVGPIRIRSGNEPLVNRLTRVALIAKTIASSVSDLYLGM